jgi:hypothetical protein
MAETGLWLANLPKSENDFEADFSRVKVYEVFASRLPLGKPPTPTLEKSHLKSSQDQTGPS